MRALMAMPCSHNQGKRGRILNLDDEQAARLSSMTSPEDVHVQASKRSKTNTDPPSQECTNHISRFNSWGSALDEAKCVPCSSSMEQANLSSTGRKHTSDTVKELDGEPKQKRTHSKSSTHSQQCIPHPAMYNMYQPFLQQVAAGIAAGLAQGATAQQQQNRAAKPVDHQQQQQKTDNVLQTDAAVLTPLEQLIPGLKDCGVNLTELFQPMVQTLFVMAANPQQAYADLTQKQQATEEYTDCAVLTDTQQGSILTDAVPLVSIRSKHHHKCHQPKSVLNADPAVAAVAPAAHTATSAVARGVPNLATIGGSSTAAATATAAAAAMGCTRCVSSITVQQHSAIVAAHDVLQMQPPFVSPMRSNQASPEQQQQAVGAWMSSSSSTAGAGTMFKSPKTSVTGIPRPGTTTSKKQQQQPRLYSADVPPFSSTKTILDLSQSGNAADSKAAPVPATSQLPAAAAVSRGAAGVPHAAAAAPPRAAPGPEASQAINVYRQHIAALEHTLGNLHPQVGKAYLALANMLTQEGSIWSISMAQRAQQRAAQILQQLRQRASVTMGAIDVTVAAGADLPMADAYVTVTAIPAAPQANKQHQKH